MFNTFYSSKIFIISLIISIFTVFIMPVNNDKHYYTLVLVPKIYNLNNKIYDCSNETDIMFASYYAVKSIYDENYTEEELLPSNLKKYENKKFPWTSYKGMNFILFNRNFTIFPLSNNSIEIKIHDYKKINGELIKKNIFDIIKNMQTIELHHHLDPLQFLNFDIDIVANRNKKICKTYYNIAYENYTTKKADILYYL